MKSPLALLAAFVLFVALPCVAATGPSAAAPSTGDAAFLQTLAAGPGAVPGGDSLIPSPLPLSTLCNSNADCPPKQLCCYPCGIDDCHNVCMTPVRGHCPLFV